VGGERERNRIVRVGGTKGARWAAGAEKYEASPWPDGFNELLKAPSVHVLFSRE